MSHEENAAQYLWQRDEARAKVVKLECELERARMALHYADQAVRAEYERFVAYVVRPHKATAFDGGPQCACGYTMPKGAKFCVKCGATFSARESQ